MNVYISAGEPSGDIYGAAVAQTLTQWSECTVTGMGGPLMKSAGVDVNPALDQMSTIGFAEVLMSLPRHVKHFHDTRSRFRKEPPAVAILVDYPGYHLRLARAASKLRVPVLYYVAPQLWAWGAGRIKTMRESVGHIAAILPFEEEYFSRRGVPTTFVGHPLLERGAIPSRATARRQLGVSDNEIVLAVFPGSRAIEIGRHWPLFRETAQALRQLIPDLRILVARTDSMELDELGECQAVNCDSFVTIAAADVVLGKSGTTTLETTLVGRPMCIAYKTNELNYQLAKRLITCDHIGLVNLLLGRRAVPEFVQRDATTETLTKALLPLFDPSDTRVREQLEAMNEAKDKMGTPGTARRVSELALELAA